MSTNRRAQQENLPIVAQHIQFSTAPRRQGLESFKFYKARKLQASQGYTEIDHLKKQNKTTKKGKTENLKHE